MAQSSDCALRASIQIGVVAGSKPAEKFHSEPISPCDVAVKKMK
jgi:hypothetical protein